MRAPVPELVHRVHGEDVEGFELADPRQVEERVAPQVSSSPPHDRAEGSSEKEDATCGHELRAHRRDHCRPPGGENGRRGEDRDHGEHECQRGPSREGEEKAEADHREAEHQRAGGRDAEVSRPAREAEEERAG